MWSLQYVVYKQSIIIMDGTEEDMLWEDDLTAEDENAEN